MRKLGIIAGAGNLPAKIIKEARERNVSKDDMSVLVALIK